MKNRLDVLEQYKSEILELKKKLAEKEAEYLDASKDAFEQETGWKFGKTILINKNGPVKLKILLNSAELRNGAFTVIGNVVNKTGGLSSQRRIIAMGRIINIDVYEEFKDD